jgi:hypothetical protein
MERNRRKRERKIWRKGDKFILNLEESHNELGRSKKSLDKRRADDVERDDNLGRDDNLDRGKGSG